MRNGLEVFLESAVRSLLESYGLKRSTERIRALLVVEPEFGPGGASSGDEATVRDASEKIFTAMNRLAFSPGATVTFYRLRQDPELASLPKEIFDAGALLLQREH